MTCKRPIYGRNDCRKKTIPDVRERAHSSCPYESNGGACISYCTGEAQPSLAMVYGVNQCWKDVVDGMEGFKRGTIFCDLYKPFMGDKCKKGGYCK